MSTYPGGDALPEHDFPPASRVDTFYVIASTARSGSTLLARLLGGSGVAGRPAEYLNAGLAGEMQQRVGNQDLFGLLRHVMRLRTSPNGVFGIKLHWIQMDVALLQQGVDLATALRPTPRWVWVRREDKLRQAVSLVKARQSGRWHSTAQAVGEPVYDGAAIARDLAAYVRDDAAWERYFAERGIRPCTVWFRELVTDRAATLRRVFTSLGLDPDTPVPPPGLARQADAVSDAWVERFRAEAAARGEALPAAWGAGP